jgi:signal peptidase I
MKKFLAFPLVPLTLLALALWAVQGVGLTLVKVKGPSMIPSYADGQVLFVNRLAYGLQGPIIGHYLWMWKAPTAGDAVVVRKPDGQWVVKRVVGLPGMPLKVAGHTLDVGGREVALTPAQEYWLSSCGFVPEGSFFVLGDNADRSQDSRDWGFVDSSDVVGRSFF